MNTGTEWLIDAGGCSSELLGDLRVIREACDEIIEDLDLHVVGEPLCYKFPQPGGITVLFLLRESHLTCHTFPETGVATFNLYCCKPRPRWDWAGRLRYLLGAAEVRVRVATRGTGNEEQSGAEDCLLP